MSLFKNYMNNKAAVHSYFFRMLCNYFEGQVKYSSVAQIKKPGRLGKHTSLHIIFYSLMNQSSALSQVSWRISLMRSLSSFDAPMTDKLLAVA